MQTWTATRRAVAVLAAGALMLTLCSPARSAGAKGKGRDPNVFRTDLNKRCAKEPLAGVWVKPFIKDKAGKGLALAVVVDDPAQIPLLETLANKLLKKYPGLAPLFPDGVKVAEKEVFPVRSKMLPQLQNTLVEESGFDEVLLQEARYDAEGRLLIEGLVSKRDLQPAVREFVQKQLAETPLVKGGLEVDTALKVADWEVAKDRLQSAFVKSADPVLLRTRVDRSSFRYSPNRVLELHIQGVCCAEGLPAGDAGRDELLVRLTKVCEKFAPVQVKLFGKNLNTARVEMIAPPAYDFQTRAVEEAGLDRVLFRTVRYDEKGVLLPEGLFDGSPASKDRVKRALEDLFQRQLKGHLSLRPGPGQAWSLDRMRPTEWGVVPERLQEGFATSGDPILQQTRVDRTYFWYSPNRVLELHLRGISLFEKLKDGGDALDELLIRATKVCESTAPGLSKLFGKNLNVSGIVALDPPQPRLQAEVAQTPPLDGVRIDGVTGFDRKGWLGLRGIWNNPSQEGRLRQLVEAAYKGKPGALDGTKVSFTDFQTVATSQILKQLRKWTADHLEEVWLDRLYYDASYQMRFHGFAPPAEGFTKVRGQVGAALAMALDPLAALGLLALPPGVASGQEEQIQRELQRIKDRLPPRERQLIDAPALPKSPVSLEQTVVLVTTALLQRGEPDPTVQLRSWPGVVRTLRQKVQGRAGPPWAGVLIERASFDENGTYVVAGLVDNDAQKGDVNPILSALLNELKDRDQWPLPGTSGEWRLGMTRLPLRPMLEALNEVMLDYPEFDGLRVAGAYHDLQNRLVLTGYEVKGLSAPGPEKRLKVLLDEDGIWERRSKFGVAMRLEGLKRDENVAELGVQRTLDLLRDGLADSGAGPGMSCYAPSLPSGPMAAGGRVPALLPPYRQLVRQYVGSVRKEIADAGMSYLTTSVMHSPDDSTAWFVRAMIYMSRGRLRQAARDLRRLAAIESEQTTAREARLVKIEMLQGTLRMVTNDYADHVAVVVGGGRAHLSLADIRAEQQQAVMARAPVRRPTTGRPISLTARNRAAPR
jgi:hypothetical protein